MKRRRRLRLPHAVCPCCQKVQLMTIVIHIYLLSATHSIVRSSNETHKIFLLYTMSLNHSPSLFPSCSFLLSHPSLSLLFPLLPPPSLPLSLSLSPPLSIPFSLPPLSLPPLCLPSLSLSHPSVVNEASSADQNTTLEEFKHATQSTCFREARESRG